MTKEIIQKALKLRYEYDGSIYKLLRDMDICLFRVDMAKYTAFTAVVDDIHTILISDKLDEIEEQFILTHELGHILFHDKKSWAFSKIYDNNCKYEYQANVFAVFFNNFSYQSDINNNVIKKTINYILGALPQYKLDEIYIY